MNTNVHNKESLTQELLQFGNEGVALYVDGTTIEPNRDLADLLLAEDGCTYMRNYIFKGEKVVGLEFEKIYL